MGRKTDQPGWIGQVGPVEPDPQSGTYAPEPADPDATAPIRLRAWWDRLSRWPRAGLLLLTAAALALAAAYVTSSHHPSPPRPGADATPTATATAPAPYPGLITDIDFVTIERPQGSVGSAASRHFTFYLSMTDTGTAPVTVTHIDQPYSGMTVSLLPRAPIRLAPHTALVVGVSATVRDCTGVPTEDDLPFVDVTLSNMRAIQTESEILGAVYTNDLHRAILHACLGRPGFGEDRP